MIQPGTDPLVIEEKDDMTKNWPLIDAVLKQIYQHPETHDQSNWFGDLLDDTSAEDSECGTTACFAGWATRLGGLQRVPASVMYGDTKGYSTGFKGFSAFVYVDGVATSPSFAGGDLLGLTAVESSQLFYYAGTLDKIETLIEVWREADGVGMDEELRQLQDESRLTRVR